MPVPQPTRAEHDEFLMLAESRIQEAVDEASIDFLDRVKETVQSGIRLGWPQESLVAATTADLPISLATLQGWWSDAVNRHVTGAIIQVWNDTYLRTHPDFSTLDVIPAIAAQVTDRLVLGLTPPLPDDAMDKVRVAITMSAANAWSSTRTSREIAVVLGWDPASVTLERAIDDYTSDLSAILDPLGPPGTPDREIARETDPAVADLQAARSRVVLALDEQQTYWQNRATRIARTESTIVYNAANLAALNDEGWIMKEWVATRDTRTRDAHRNANGQTRPLNEPFTVGGVAMQSPGDPTAPASEIVNCRCIVIGVETPDDTLI